MKAKIIELKEHRDKIDKEIAGLEAKLATDEAKLSDSVFAVYKRNVAGNLMLIGTFRDKDDADIEASLHPEHRNVYNGELYIEEYILKSSAPQYDSTMLLSALTDDGQIENWGVSSAIEALELKGMHPSCTEWQLMRIFEIEEW